MTTLTLIDDNKVDRKVTERVINKHQLADELLIFENGESFVEHLETLHEDENTLTDIIFLDLNMPGLDGWDILEELTQYSEALKGTQLYIFTSSISEEDKKRALAYPFVTDFLVKPFDYEKFKDLLKQVLKNP